MSEYIPHITVGDLPDVEALDKAYEDIKDNRRRFVSGVHKISVEMIGEKEKFGV